MRKTLIAVPAAVAGAVITGASPAQAWCFWGCDAGVGAPAAGPPPGGPFAGSTQPYGAYYGYGPAYFYAPAQTYYGPSPGCFWRNQRFWDCLAAAGRRRARPPNTRRPRRSRAHMSRSRRPI
jgi:hypothetical protein